MGCPAGFQISGLSQAESARPFTITTADNSGRIAVNGVPTSLDEFRATPYIQTDLRVSRPIRLGDRWTIMPVCRILQSLQPEQSRRELCHQRRVASGALCEAQAGNVTSICTNSDCTATEPITGLKQLGVPAGALGDFFGPGTTVGIPFAAQLGVRVSF